MAKPLSNLFVAAAVLAFGAEASARTVRDEPYSLDTTWNAAVRMVRVDMGFSITERDRDLGYFTFDYREGGRSVPGSVEIVRTELDGRPSSRVIVQIPQMPNYVEAMILTRLGQKLRTEFGDPPPAPRRPAAPGDRPSSPPPGVGTAPPPSPPSSPSPPESPSPPSNGPNILPPHQPPSGEGEPRERERR